MKDPFRMKIYLHEEYDSSHYTEEKMIKVFFQSSELQL